MTALLFFGLVVVMALFVGWMVKHSGPTPLAILIGAQTFRVGVELFIRQLWRDGIVPEMLTYRGANVDIYIGGTALAAAWISTRGTTGLWIARVWNVLGLFVLANVVVRAIATSPALHLIPTEVPNRMFVTFPFMLIPGFFVPLAVALHVLALRRISAGLRYGTAMSNATDQL